MASAAHHRGCGRVLADRSIFRVERMRLEGQRTDQAECHDAPLMSIELVSYFFLWLLLATFGAAALWLGWRRVSERQQARSGRDVRQPEASGIRRKRVARVADAIAAATAA